jgi:hypothetical protein
VDFGRHETDDRRGSRRIAWANLASVRAEIARQVIAGESLVEIVHSSGVDGETL